MHAYGTSEVSLGNHPRTLTYFRREILQRFALETMAEAKRELKDKEDDLVAELKEAFACFDKNSDGSITAVELGTVLSAMNQKFTDAELKNIVGQFDVDGDGQIDFSEFMSMMTNFERKDVDELKEAFRVFDKDGDGSITAKEIEMVMRALGEEIDRETIDLMIKSVDSDGNGTIDFAEFKKMMQDGPVPVS